MEELAEDKPSEEKNNGGGGEGREEEAPNPKYLECQGGQFVFRPEAPRPLEVIFVYP